VGLATTCGAVALFGVRIDLALGLVDQPALLEAGLGEVPLADAPHVEAARQGVDRLGADAVQADTELKYLVVVFRARVDTGNAIDDLPQRDAPAEWLAQYPRYMKALANRVQRLSGQYGKDQKYTALLAGLTEPLTEAAVGRPGLLLLCEPALRYRWMLEELRVSLFAQNLGTRMAVSEKRLREVWREVLAWQDQNPL